MANVALGATLGWSWTAQAWQAAPFGLSVALLLTLLIEGLTKRRQRTWRNRTILIVLGLVALSIGFAFDIVDAFCCSRHLAFLYGHALVHPPISPHILCVHIASVLHCRWHVLGAYAILCVTAAQFHMQLELVNQIPTLAWQLGVIPVVTLQRTHVPTNVISQRANLLELAPDPTKYSEHF